MAQAKVNLVPVKTLTEWFANLPLIYKLDLYNSYTGTITKRLTQRMEARNVSKTNRTS